MSESSWKRVAGGGGERKRGEGKRIISNLGKGTGRGNERLRMAKWREGKVEKGKGRCKGKMKGS